MSARSNLFRFFIMAILLNIISSGSRRSAGAATFRRVRGRTIMSQKRGSSTRAAETRAAAGLIRTYNEAMFYIVNAFAAGMKSSVNASFEPTRYGSARNAFTKLNWSAVEHAVNGSPLGLAVLDQLMHEVSFVGVTGPWGEDGAELTFENFNVAGWNALFEAARVVSPGVLISYTRSTVGGVKMLTNAYNWDSQPDPLNPRNISFVVSVNTATAAGQQITSIKVTATDWPTTPRYTVSVSGVALAGSWAGNVFTPTNSPRFNNAGTVRILSGDVVIAERVVQFATSNEVSGE